MQEKSFTLINKGMNRDLSISKAGESSAYENLNIRIEAREGDTLLSVTNEKGNARFFEQTFHGELVGYNVLNNYLILFTHVANGLDHIYRVDTSIPESIHIFQGYLGFSLEHPIESITYYESEDVQKIYWVDGIHPLRFMNFMNSLSGTQGASYLEYAGFDSNAGWGVQDNYISAEITKDNTGQTRPNGVIQYFVTYYNRYGQESGCAWISDLVYLSPMNVGGNPEETNNNKITLKFTHTYTPNYSKFRVYSLFRSSLNGTPVAYLVGEADIASNSINDEEITIVDDGSHLELVDASSILFLGSRDVKPYTIEHKDQTLFLGNLKLNDKAQYTEIQNAINQRMFSVQVEADEQQVPFEEGVTYLAYCVSFERSTGNNASDIPYVKNTGTYPYNNQLAYTSAEITSFKGGELYRFALVFIDKNGNRSDAFWIGDRVNGIYPQVDSTNGNIHRVIARCTVPYDVITAAISAGFIHVQLMIAEASYSDRSIKAQGVLNPTMFNVLDRYNKGLYSMPSWITRSRGEGIETYHFSPVKNANTPYGEIECNYWTTLNDPRPYYRLDISSPSNPKYLEEYDGMPEYEYVLIVYEVKCVPTGTLNLSWKYEGSVTVVFGNTTSSAGITNLLNADFVNDITFTDGAYQGDGFYLRKVSSGTLTTGSAEKTASKDTLYSKMVDYVVDVAKLSERYVVSYEQYDRVWCNYAHTQRLITGTYYWNLQFPSVSDNRSTFEAAANCNIVTNPEGRWITDGRAGNSDKNYIPAEYTKHLMFVDENVVTLDSPELAERAVYIDNAEGYKLRVVGVANVTSNIADYTVDATHGHLSGTNLVQGNYSTQAVSINVDGIISRPLWTENGLVPENSSEFPGISEATSDDYKWGSQIVNYWLHLWGKTGFITGFSENEGEDYSNLHSKTIANLRFAYNTVYTGINSWSYPLDSLRMFDYDNSQYLGISIGTGNDADSRFYDGYIDTMLSMPGTHKYPILYSYNLPEQGATSFRSSYFMLSDSYVPLTFASAPHAVMSLHSEYVTSNGVKKYKQTILPYAKSASSSYPGPVIPQRDVTTYPEYTGALLPWKDNYDESIVGDYKYIDYTIDCKTFTPSADVADFNYTNPYVLIGELYQDFTNITDTRYGGKMLRNVADNKFIPAGETYSLEDLRMGSGRIYGTQGDTFIQRWDGLRIKPVGTQNTNNVIDVISVLVETHINLDGRYDNLRGTTYLASVDANEFGKVNPVYTQPNNFVTSVYNNGGEVDEDTFKTAVTWTLEKSDLADIDEWSHITLGSSLKLDGDKGECKSIHRFGNSLIAFQDKGIAEILFNSRTQISTEQGVPIEIANSGKVDGKRYITTKYGCINKWSIVEGKAALYFVDNINKAFCAFNGEGVTNLSTKLGFEAWFRANNSVKAWDASSTSDNFIGFYDRIHSDIYLVNGDDTKDQPTIVYNEPLGVFTTFMSYGNVPMMTNVMDKFLSFKDGYLWSQNEGGYCNFFGTQYPFSMKYRVAPSPNDKVWTNLEYRADFFSLSASSPEDPASAYGYYEPDATFDALQIVNEYQDTGAFTAPVAKKRFRIWRTQIPRAQIDGNNNPYGLDRIRNPWIHLKFTKSADANSNRLMQLHDITVKYFE